MPSDVNLTLFTVDKAPKMWATMKDILSVNPDINFFAAPYSAPAWMKTSGSLSTGMVKEEYEGVWAKYLCRAMVDIGKKGVRVKKLRCVSVIAAVCSDHWSIEIFGFGLTRELGASARSHPLTSCPSDFC